MSSRISRPFLIQILVLSLVDLSGSGVRPARAAAAIDEVESTGALCAFAVAAEDRLAVRLNLTPGPYRCIATLAPPSPDLVPVGAALVDRDGDGNVELAIAYRGAAGGAVAWRALHDGSPGAAEVEPTFDASPAMTAEGDLLVGPGEGREAGARRELLLAGRMNRDAHPELLVRLEDGAVGVAELVQATVVVNSTAEVVDFGGAQQIADLPGADGLVTLREAILAANYTSGADTIQFNIPGSGNDCHDGACWFTPSDGEAGPLPAILASGGAVTLDGYTQTTNQGDDNPDGPELVLDGTGQSGDNGLLFQGVAANAVIDFVIQNFDGAGIRAEDADGLLVQGCYIGTDPTGTTAAANLRGMLLFASTDGAQIGATGTHGAPPVSNGNLISGNTQQGIRIESGTGNMVRNNRIGTDPTGDLAVPNDEGIRTILPSAGTVIGGTTSAERNRIAGNTASGIALGGDTGTTIAGNWIGLDEAGATALPNGYAGIFVEAATGTTIGGTATGTGNVISGNAFGVVIYLSTGALVARNYIGTSADGSAAVGNGIGVQVDAGSNNDIGNGTQATRNLISGNQSFGVTLASTAGNRVRGNWIGLDAAGTAALPNVTAGIGVNGTASANAIGGTSADQANYIVGSVSGIELIEDSTGTLVRGNRIGAGPSSTIAAFANNFGIRIGGNSAGSTIGGAGAAGNEITNSIAQGIAIVSADAVGHKFTRNSIHDNGALGIDLGADGVTANDPGDNDDGANGLQNYPVLASAINGCGTGVTTIAGTVSTNAPDTGAVELFINPASDPSGFGEGQTWIGTTTPAFNGSFNTVVPALAPGTQVSATFTSGSGSTSEFSGVVTVYSTPAEPSALGAILQPGPQIALTWTDNANSETGFRIERRAGAGSFSFLANAAANATGFTDPGPLAFGTTYSYRVRAESPGCFSQYSNVASADVPANYTPFCRRTVSQHLPAANAQVAAAGPGSFGIVWREIDDDRTKLYYARLDSTGATVGAPVVVRDSARQAIGTMLVWSGDRWGMVWYERLVDRFGIFFQTLALDGSVLTGPIAVQGAAAYPILNPLLQPGFAWDGQGWGIAWPDDRNSLIEVRYAHIAADGTTKDATDVLVNDSGLTASGPSLAWNGTHHVVAWWDGPGGSQQIYTRRFARNGTPAGASVAATTGAVNAADFVELKWDGASELGIAWNDGRDTNPVAYFRRLSLAGAPLSAETRIADPEAPDDPFEQQLSLYRLANRWAVAVEDFRAPEANEEIRLSFADLTGAKLGSDVLVSTPTADDYADDPSLAWDGTRILVAWHESVAAGSYEVVAQATDEAGSPGANPRRNVTSGHVPGNGVSLVSLELMPVGFAATWLDRRSNLVTEPYLRRVGGDGVAVGSEIAVADGGVGLGTGQLSSAWSGEVLAVAWFNSPAVVLSFFDADGVKIGTDIALPMADNPSGLSDVHWTGEHFLVAFEKSGAPNANELFVAAYLPDGTLASGPNQISVGSGRSGQPALAGEGDDLAVVWRDTRDGTTGEIYAAALDSLGNRVGPEIRITNQAADSRSPTLAWSGSEFGLAWEDVRTGLPEIRFRRLAADATASGGEIQLSAGFSRRPAIASDGIGWGVVFGGLPAGNGGLGGLYLARVTFAGAEFGSERLALQNATFPSGQAIVWDGAQYVVADSEGLYVRGEVTLKSSSCALDATPPACPTGLAATLSGRNVSLMWNPAEEADFAVERQSVLRDGVVIATVVPTAASYADVAPVAGLHQYSIGATNGGYLEAAGCASIAVTVPLFKDGFESGSLSAWSGSSP